MVELPRSGQLCRFQLQGHIFVHAVDPGLGLGVALRHHVGCPCCCLVESGRKADVNVEMDVVESNLKSPWDPHFKNRALAHLFQVPALDDVSTANPGMNVHSPFWYLKSRTTIPKSSQLRKQKNTMYHPSLGHVLLWFLLRHFGLLCRVFAMRMFFGCRRKIRAAA